MPSKYKNKKIKRILPEEPAFKHVAQETRCISLKNGYDTEQDALKSVILRERPLNIALRAYRCNNCHQWHLTRRYT